MNCPFLLRHVDCRAFGAPGLRGDSFMLDMATSTVALGKVEISQRRGSDIPNTWGVNAEGRFARGALELDPTHVALQVCR